jgi:hypothetical protein
MGLPGESPEGQGKSELRCCLIRLIIIKMKNYILPRTPKSIPLGTVITVVVVIVSIIISLTDK